jgi:hypothetical protein
LVWGIVFTIFEGTLFVLQLQFSTLRMKTLSNRIHPWQGAQLHSA